MLTTNAMDEFLLNSIENKTGVVEMQIISLQGRITVGNANEMRRKLADALLPQLPKLTVDLSGVTYMDTSGLATLMEAMRIARQPRHSAGFEWHPRSTAISS